LKVIIKMALGLTMKSHSAKMKETIILRDHLQMVIME